MLVGFPGPDELLGILLVNWSLILAQTPGNIGDLANYGFLGIAVAVLTKFAWSAWRDLKEDRDEWKKAALAAIAALQDTKNVAAAGVEVGAAATDLLEALRRSLQGDK